MSPPSSELPRGRGGVLLLTGATGFLGGAFLAEVARARAPFHTIVLARGPAAPDRLRASLSVHLGADAAEQALSRSTVIDADLRLLDAARDVPWSEITHAVHAAANTSFRSRNDVFHTNVGGTLALAEKLRHARRLQRFLYVGTAYQCGTEAGPLVLEDDTSGDSAPHLVEYTRSKARAEAALRERAADLPVVIARPSVIAGHTALGLRPSASMFWYYRALATMNLGPFPPGRRKDIIPVDHAARALLYLLTSPTLAHTTYHISAGVDSAEPWDQIASALCSAYGIVHGSPPELAGEADLAERGHSISRVCGAPDTPGFITALRAFFTFARYSAEVFDCRRLLAEGFPPSPPFTSYVPRCGAEPGGRTVFQEMQDDL